MDNTNEYKSWKKSLKNYRLLLLVGGISSFAFILTAIILKSIYASPSLSLFDEVIDNIIFESTLIFFGAFFGSAIIGILFDRYSSIFSEKEELLLQRYENEGILKVFYSDYDPELITFLNEQIKNLKNDLVAIGLGLGLFAKNKGILDTIGQKLSKNKEFNVHFIFPDSKNPGLNERITEEELTQSSYDKNWVVRYPEEIKSGILDEIESKIDETKINIKYSDYFPLMTIIKLDDYFLYYSYGSPNIRGSKSPWLLVDTQNENNKLGKFIKKTYEFYMQ